MQKQTTLKIILILSIAGILFSGYLSYTELFKSTCALGGTCPIVGSIPACVYGFVMYLIVMIISIIGIKLKN